MTDKNLGWIPVSINHLNPKWLRCEYTFEHRLMIDGEDVSQWLREMEIQWTYDYNSKTMMWPILLFKREEDATLFALRWS